MTQQEFIAKMAIAYMQHHGCTASVANLEDWKGLWHVIGSMAH